MIGKVYVSVFPFYDIKNNRMDYKKRPVLIIGKADETDYVVLPISRVTNSMYIHSEYDIAIDLEEVPLMKLIQRSYIRVHKVTIINQRELDKEIVDFKENYEDRFIDIISKFEEFSKSIIDKAL